MNISVEKVEFDRWYPDSSSTMEAIVDGEVEDVSVPRKTHVVIGVVELAGNSRFEIKRVRKQWKVYRELVVTGCDDVSMGMSLEQMYMFGYGNNMPVMELTTKTGTEREAITFTQLLETVHRLEGKIGVLKVVGLFKLVGAEEIVPGLLPVIGKLIG